jgi:metallophosphoesterase superfamily enzyme
VDENASLRLIAGHVHPALDLYASEIRRFRGF